MIDIGEIYDIYKIENNSEGRGVSTRGNLQPIERTVNV